MKKVFASVLFLILLLELAACDPGMRSLDGYETLSNTTKIELFYYENASPKLVRLAGKNEPILDFSKATLIATLDEARIEEVVKDIEQYDMTLFGGRTLNEPIGKTLILYQSDGNMIVLFGCVYTNKYGGKRYYGMCNKYDENGLFIEYLGDIDCDYVDTLESKYFVSNE